LGQGKALVDGKGGTKKGIRKPKQRKEKNGNLPFDFERADFGRRQCAESLKRKNLRGKGGRARAQNHP